MPIDADDLYQAMSALAKSEGAALVALERRRQQANRHDAGEEFSREHDAEHVNGELIQAGMSYAWAAVQAEHEPMDWEIRQHGSREAVIAARVAERPYSYEGDGSAGMWWPWDNEWWKPSTDPVRNLVRAGALIAAEIDRLLALRTPAPFDAER